MIGYPFDSQVTYDGDTGEPIYDRAISSKPLRKIYNTMFTNGVFPNPSTNLQVIAGSGGMNVIVKSGACIIEGCIKIEESDRTLAVQQSSKLDRIDTVVIRLNDNVDVRECDLYIVEGTPASSPIRPELTRSGDIYEIGIADIFISKESTDILPEKITDTRLETSRCGYVSSISEFDTTTLYRQIKDDLDGFKISSEADFATWVNNTQNSYTSWINNRQTTFDEWFDSIQGTLSGDVAGNLQQEIDDLNTALQNVGGVIVSDTQPNNINTLWIDSTNDFVPKFYNGTNWVTLVAVWG